MGKLTAAAVCNAVPSNKRKKLSDGEGLYLLITPKGGCYWRYDYRYGGRRRTLALGVYPRVGLKDARMAHCRARMELADGLDPSARKKLLKQQIYQESLSTFEAISREWFERKIADKSDSYRSRTLRMMEKDLSPILDPDQ